MASPAPESGPSTSQPTATETRTAPALRGTYTSLHHVTESAALPPLTTPWSHPQSCTWTYVADLPNAVSVQDAVAWLDLEPIPGASTLTCYPDGMFSPSHTGVFSPGICPGGWTTASLQSETDAAKGGATTTAICCSYGYTLTGSNCRRPVPTALAVPISYNTTAGTYDLFTQSTATLYSAMLSISTIRVLFQDEDKLQLGIGLGKGNGPETLPMNTRIGIAIGVGTAILILLGVLYFTRVRRRRCREGLTKDRLMRDLHSLNQHRPSVGHGQYRGNMSFYSEPPPAYDRGRRMSSGTRSTSRRGPRDNERGVQSDQKAVIHQRLDDLERVSGEDPRASGK